MQSNKKSGNKANSRRKGKNNGRGQKKQPQLYQSGTICRPLPAQFRTLMTYQNGETFGTSTKVVRGLSEFLAKPPMFYNYLFGIYKYCRVIAVDVEVHWTSTGSDPSRVVVGRVPYSDTSGITYAQLGEMPESSTAILSAKGGMDRLVLRAHFRAKAANGAPLTDHSYWVNSAQAISTTPLHNDDYVIVIMSDGVGVASASSAIVKIHYHIEWFEMQYAV